VGVNYCHLRDGVCMKDSIDEEEAATVRGGGIHIYLPIGSKTSAGTYTTTQRDE